MRSSGRRRATFRTACERRAHCRGGPARTRTPVAAVFLPEPNFGSSACRLIDIISDIGRNRGKPRNGRQPPSRSPQDSLRFGNRTGAVPTLHGPRGCLHRHLRPLNDQPPRSRRHGSRRVYIGLLRPLRRLARPRTERVNNQIGGIRVKRARPVNSSRIAAQKCQLDYPHPR